MYVCMCRQDTCSISPRVETRIEQAPARLGEEKL